MPMPNCCLSMEQNTQRNGLRRRCNRRSLPNFLSAAARSGAACGRCNRYCPINTIIPHSANYVHHLLPIVFLGSKKAGHPKVSDLCLSPISLLFNCCFLRSCFPESLFPVIAGKTAPPDFYQMCIRDRCWFHWKKAQKKMKPSF